MIEKPGNPDTVERLRHEIERLVSKVTMSPY
jgi:hypothetical protein